MIQSGEASGGGCGGGGDVEVVGGRAGDGQAASGGAGAVLRYDEVFDFETELFQGSAVVKVQQNSHQMQVRCAAVSGAASRRLHLLLTRTPTAHPHRLLSPHRPSNSGSYKGGSSGATSASPTSRRATSSTAR